MKVDIETNKALPVLAQLKGEKLQVLSHVMNDEVLTLFSDIAKKADTPEKIKEFNEKVLKNKEMIEATFTGGNLLKAFFGGN